jgi:hypothetical protein
MENIANKVIDLVSQGTTSAVEAYTSYYQAESLGWILFGIVIILGGIWGFRKALTENCSDERLQLQFVSVIVIIFGSFFIPFNIGTAVSPKAFAIHQIISDLKK